MPRALLKTFTYSLMHLTEAVSVAYALTRNIAVALSIGLIEPFVQTIAYALHERLWEKRQGQEVDAKGNRKFKQAMARAH